MDYLQESADQTALLLEERPQQGAPLGIAETPHECLPGVGIGAGEVALVVPAAIEAVGAIHKNRNRASKSSAGQAQAFLYQEIAR